MGILANYLLVFLSVFTFVNSTILDSSWLASGLNAAAKNLSTAKNHQQAVRFDYNSVVYKKSPEQIQNLTNLAAQAKASLVYDQNSAQYLYKNNVDEKLPIASLTKLATVMVILQNHKLDETVEIPKLTLLDPSLAQLKVKEGMKFSVADMISALLISSSADVANALAIWDSGSIDNFVDKMNKFARDWEMDETHFDNPIGVDSDNHYSTATNILTLTQVALAREVVSDAVAKKSAVISNNSGQKFILLSTNQLLTNPNISGVKTGTTLKAGQCFIGLYKDQNKELITIVLNSPSRFVESQSMLNFVSNNFVWI